jgi:tetratricopeptide (TPR) repeat protein
MLAFRADHCQVERPDAAGARRFVLLRSRKMSWRRRPSPAASAAGLVYLVFLGVAAPAAAHAPIEEQIEALSLRIAAHPGDASLYLRRGELHRLLRETSAARADYEKARLLDPKLAVVDLGLGTLLLETGHPADAVVVLDRFLKARPGDPAGLAARGRARARLGRPLDAADDFTRAIAASPPRRPPSPDLYIEKARAIAAAGEGHLEQALRGLEEGIERLGSPAALEIAAAAIERRLGRQQAADARLAGIGAPASSGAPRVAGPIADGGAPSPGDPPPGGGPPAPETPNVALALARGPYLQEGTPESIVVRWRTDRGADAVVRYGTSFADLLYEERDTRAIRDHAIALHALTPDTRYYYTVGSSAGPLAGAAGELSFITAPARGTRKPLLIWALGDSGTADLNARHVRDAYRDWSGGRVPDVWLMLGDNAYQSGTDAEFQAAVFGVYPDLLSRGVLWPTLGNHDGISADSETQSGPYYDIFTLPSAGEAGGLPSGTEAYYAFDYANLHFICLDSYETDRSPDGAMMTWLRADALATRQDWTIAFWHHPPYSKGSHDSDRESELIDMREAALPILEEAGVDLVLTGHSHSYERSFLLDGHYGLSTTLTPAMKKDPGNGREEGTGAYAKPTAGPARHEGAVYVVAGSSGQASGGALNHPGMYLSLNSLGSLVLDVDGERLDATFLNDKAQVLDHFTLVKGPRNTAPIAVVRVPERAECDTHAGADVVLDGSQSSDPDENRGDRIAAYEWIEGLGTPAERLLGTGVSLEVVLPTGHHAITLRVTDTEGDSGTADAQVEVVDTVPPVLDITVDPSVLWPPDRSLRLVQIRYRVADACDPAPRVTLLGVTSSEPDGSAGGGDGESADDIQGASLGEALEPGVGEGQVMLRAERAGTGPGRTYTVSGAATDASGLATIASGTVKVPHDQGLPAWRAPTVDPTP